MVLARRAFLRLGGVGLLTGASVSLGLTSPAAAKFIDTLGSAGLVAKPDIAAPAIVGLRKTAARSLRMVGFNTGERIAIDYWVDGCYLPDACAAINKFMRCFRTGAVHTIDPKLLDRLFALRDTLETNKEFEMISGYRSPAVNAKLRAEYDGVAKHSLHMQGQATDICIPGIALDRLRKVALAQRAGGVGYYPQQDFVHVDTGRTRTWQGA